MRNHYTVFHSCCTVLYSHQQLQGLQFLHIFANNCYLLCFFNNCHPNRYEVISHCHSDLHFLIINDVEHLFIYLLAICISFLEKHLFKSFDHFLIRLLGGFLLLSCKSSLYILKINPLSDIQFANIFSHSVGCLFTLLMVSFAVQQIFIAPVGVWYSPTCLFLLLLLVFLVSYPRNHRQDECQEYFPLCFFSNSFTVSSLMFKSSIHFE